MKSPTTALALGFALLGAFLFPWLFTLDVHVDEPGWSGEPAFCGSAYDVALLKRDGYMGGEVPPNQGAIDRACVDEARTAVGLSGIVAVVGLAAGSFGVVRLAKPSSVRHQANCW